ncbi:hypothetical protein SISNIDRAFT_481858 [Sistotremastrum niveocremeum HHB9708]|uniref:Zn(2)-C6 fungal-type domain-containing protein n=1 Tax=Sistotremastrum niveocremeum HHB9708 TaxID=1314777 RepID=A0A164ZRK4_9AGAM|nr:hypothetical protein SISNIDRAFT_481858 [Sistotremastrum niveocremeum HHB9708]
MAANDDVHPPMTLSHPNPGKKHRVDMAPLPPELPGAKPLQLQRRRVWRACESCRRKKIKCDGVEPTCGQCATARLQCQWSQTKDRAALSRHYVQELEHRLMQLEGMLSQVAPDATNGTNGIKSSSQSPSMANTSRPAGSPPHPRVKTSPTTSSHTSPGRDPDNVKHEDGEYSGVTEQFGQLALDEHGHSRWLGGSSTMSLVRTFHAITNPPMDRYSPASPESDPHGIITPPSVASLYFPSTSIYGKVWVEAYFAKFHFLLPVLDKPSFLRDYHKLMEEHGANSDPAFVSCVFAVFAIGMRLIDDPKANEQEEMDSELGMQLYHKAMMLQFIAQSRTQMSMALVQSYVLVASYLCASNRLPQAWLYVGQALRTAQDLGLHRSPRNLALSALEKETRVKVWWNVYCLDRMLAVSLGRPLGIDDVDCDVELPVDLDDEELPLYFTGKPFNRAAPSLMSGFVALIGLYTIAGRLLRQVYALHLCKDDLEPELMAELQSSVDSLDQQLDEWCENLPPCFKLGSYTEQQIAMGAVLCSSWYAVRITLHRNFLPIKRNQRVPSPSSISKAVSAARSCILLAPSIKHVIPPSHHLAFYIQYLFSSAVIILLWAIHATEEGAAAQAMSEANKCLDALEGLESVWPGTKKCKELLSELAKTTTETMKNEAMKRYSPPHLPLHPPLTLPTQWEPSTSVNMPYPDMPPQQQRPSRRNHSSNPGVSKRRSMSQKRPREDSEAPADNMGASGHNGHDFDRPVRTVRRNSRSHRSASQARSLNIPSPTSYATSQSFIEPIESGRVPRFEIPSQSTSQSQQSQPPLTLHSGPTLSRDNNYGHSRSESWPYTAEQSWNSTNNDIGQQSYQDYSQPYELYQPIPDQLHFSYPSTLPNDPGLSSVTPFTSSEMLPFSGLEFLQNYQPDHSLEQTSHEQWNTLATTPLNYGIDVPFSFGDGQSPENQNG